MSTESQQEARDACRAGARDLLPIVEEIEDMYANNCYWYNTTLKRERAEMFTEYHGWLIHWHRVLHEHRAAGWDTTELTEAYESFNKMMKRLADDMAEIAGIWASPGVDPYPKSQKIVTPQEVQASHAAQVSQAAYLRRLGWAALADVVFLIVMAIVTVRHINYTDAHEINDHHLGHYTAPLILSLFGLLVIGTLAMAHVRLHHPETYNLVADAVAVASTVNYLQHRQARLTGEAVARALPRPPPPPHTPGEYNSLDYGMGQR
jgi:uncharacterized integral membrane protein